MPNDKTIQCPDCGGCGGHTIQRIVSRDMAIDGGDAQLEGMTIEEHIPCERCGGLGLLWIDDSNNGGSPL